MIDADDIRLSGNDEQERFRVRSRAEVTGILRALLDRDSLITVYMAGSRESFVTALLTIDGETGTFTFDYGNDARMSERLPRAPAARLEGFLDHIRIEFSVSNIAAVEFDGKPAFRAPLPPSLLRIQRRDSYRVHVPKSRPILCELPPVDETGEPIRTMVRDLSVGGVALVDFPPGFALTRGTVIEGCRLHLSKTDVVSVGLETVRTQRTRFTPPAGQLVGCRFLHLTPRIETQLQRLINELDRARMAD